MKEHLKSIIARLLGLHVFAVYIAEPRTDHVEDPHCPARWKGSRCFDHEYHAVAWHRVTVIARNEMQAERLVRAYEKRTAEETEELLKGCGLREPACDPFGDEPEYVGVVRTSAVPDSPVCGVVDVSVKEPRTPDWTRRNPTISLGSAVLAFAYV